MQEPDVTHVQEIKTKVMLMNTEQSRWNIPGEPRQISQDYQYRRPDVEPNWYWKPESGDPEKHPVPCEFDGHKKALTGYFRLPGQSRKALYQCPSCNRYATLDASDQGET